MTQINRARANVVMQIRKGKIHRTRMDQILKLVDLAIKEKESKVSDTSNSYVPFSWQKTVFNDYFSTTAK